MLTKLDDKIGNKREGERKIELAYAPARKRKKLL